MGNDFNYELFICEVIRLIIIEKELKYVHLLGKKYSYKLIFQLEIQCLEKLVFAQVMHDTMQIALLDVVNSFLVKLVRKRNLRSDLVNQVNVIHDLFHHFFDFIINFVFFFEADDFIWDDREHAYTNKL